MDELNWVMLVETMKNLHRRLPNIHSPAERDEVISNMQAITESLSAKVLTMNHCDY